MSTSRMRSIRARASGENTVCQKLLMRGSISASPIRSTSQASRRAMETAEPPAKGSTRSSVLIPDLIKRSPISAASFLLPPGHLTGDDPGLIDQPGHPLTVQDTAVSSFMFQSSFYLDCQRQYSTTNTCVRHNQIWTANDPVIAASQTASWIAPASD